MKSFFKNETFSIIITGIMIMYYSHAAGMIMGDAGRLLTLFVGFLLIISGVLLRCGQKWLYHLPMLWFLLMYEFLLELNSRALEHSDFFTSSLVATFRFIIVLLFFAGFLAGRYRPCFSEVNEKCMFVVSFVTALLSVAAIRNISIISHLSSNSRAVGGNPMGVAYNYTILFLSCLCILVYAKSRSCKAAALAGSMASLIVVIVSGSRGPLIWSVLSILVIIYINRKSIMPVIKRRFGRIVIYSTLILLCIPMLLTTISHVDLLSSRIENLGGRFSGTIDYLAGQRGMDQALEERYEVVKMYLDEPEKWFFRGFPKYIENPHNMLIEIFVRFGFLFSIPMFLAIFIALRRVFKITLTKMSFRFSLESNFVFILFIFAFLQSFSSLYLEINRVFWFGLGYLVGLKYDKIDNKFSCNLDSVRIKQEDLHSG